MKTTIAALSLLALVACGSPAPSEPGAGGGGSDGSPGTLTPYDPESPISCPPDCGDGGGDVEPGKPQIVEPQPGMQDLRPVGWDKAKVLGPRSVLITYWSGVEPCNVLDHVDVVYKAKTVEVTIYEGSDPTDQNTACIEIALLKGVELTLDEPLDGRKITDGAS